MKVTFQDELDKWERLTIADALEEVEFDDGHQIVTKGDNGKDFFFILEGYVTIINLSIAYYHSPSFSEVTVDGFGKNNKTLTTGDYFGEVALLLQAPRSATVTARGRVRAARLDNVRFERVLAPAMDVLKERIAQYQGIHF